MFPLGQTWSMSLKYPEKMSSASGWVTTLLRAVTVSVTSKASVKPSAASAASLIGSIRSTPRPVTVSVPVNASPPRCPPAARPAVVVVVAAAGREQAAEAERARAGEPALDEGAARDASALHPLQPVPFTHQTAPFSLPPHGRWDYVDGPRRPATGGAPTCRYRHGRPCIRSCAARVNSGLSKVGHRARHDRPDPPQKGPLMLLQTSGSTEG